MPTDPSASRRTLRGKESRDIQKRSETAASPAADRKGQARLYLGCLVGFILLSLIAIGVYVLVIAAGQLDEGLAPDPVTVEDAESGRQG